MRFLEFGVRARPRSVTCVHKTLTPRMKHTRVPRTVRKDIWRLAMETLSIPSLHIFWSRIRNQIKSRIENRRKTNGPNRKSNRLNYKKNPRTLCHIGLLLGLIDVVQCLHKLRTLASYKQSVTKKFNAPILLFQTKQASFGQTLYQHKSALPYMGCCTLSSCSSTKRPRRLVSTIQKKA